jgi:hypothetical protein
MPSLSVSPRRSPWRLPSRARVGDARLGGDLGGAGAHGVAEAAAGAVGEHEGGEAGGGGRAGRYGEREADVLDGVQDRAVAVRLDLAAVAGVGRAALLEDREGDAAVDLGEGGVWGGAAPGGALVVAEAGGERAGRVTGGVADLQVADRERAVVYGRARAGHEVAVRGGW